ERLEGCRLAVRLRRHARAGGLPRLGGAGAATRGVLGPPREGRLRRRRRARHLAGAPGGSAIATAAPASRPASADARTREQLMVEGALPPQTPGARPRPPGARPRPPGTQPFAVMPHPLGDPLTDLHDPLDAAVHPP